MKLRCLIILLGLGILAQGGGLFADAPARGEIMAVDAATLAARIDDLIAKKWKEKGVQPAPLADDAEYLRRVYLDLVGRIPRVAEVHAFLEDKHPDKRLGLVNRLLENPLYVTHLSATWRSILLPPTNQQFQVFNPAFKNWLDKQIKENGAYDQMVREILTVPVGFNPVGRGQPFVQQPNNNMSPVGFYQANENKAENVASSTSRIFLGVKLECAQCHDHPFAKWTREQFWQYAAFFSAIEPPRRFVGGKPLPPPAKPPNGKEIKIAGTDKVVGAKFLDGKAPQWRDGTDSRVILAEWLTSQENPFFARTGANRVWAHFFGIGLIDPVDDEPTEENPISHPQLLAELSRQFVAHKFDLKYMIRAIMQSKTYQRTSAVTHESQTDLRAFARMAVKGMTPEQLFDSLAQATGYSEAPGVRNQPVQIFNPQNNPRAEFLTRFASLDKRTESHTSILQALALMNGRFIADATSVERSNTLGAIVESPFMKTEDRIEALYLAALSRKPRPEELDRLTAYVNRGGPAGDANKALADVFWALLNSSEFILNH